MPENEKPELIFRPGTREDTDRILELVSLSLGEGLIPRSRDFWSWKHHRNPFGESPVLLAEADGRLVGLRVFLRWTWHSGAREVPAVRAVDTATHPEWQGRGIFSRLTLALVERMRAEGVGFVFNTPNARSRPGYLKMGWSSVGRLDLMIRPGNPLHIATAMARPSAPPDGSAAPASPPNPANLANPETARLLADESAVLRTVLERETRTDEARYHVVRTGEYLRWRYLDVPGFRYLAAGYGDREDAALVLYRLKAQGRLVELRICDLLLGPGRRSAAIARSLLRRIRREHRPSFVAAAAASGTPLHRLLLSAGFLPAPRLGPIFTVLPMNGTPGARDPVERASWAASLGELELF